MKRIDAVRFLSLFLLATAGGIAFADKPGSFPDIPVTSTLNATGSVTPNPGTNYRVEGDGNGQYYNGVSSVSSILQGGINGASRDWILDTRSSTTRTVLVDLRTPVPNLYWYSSSKGKTTWVFIGQYYNTYRIDVTNP